MVKNALDASVFVAGIVFGTASSILSKQLFAETVDAKAFEKPLFQTTLMFLGMALALPIHMLFERWTLRKKGEESDNSNYALLESDGAAMPADESDLWTFASTKVLIFPAIFDLLATALANIGLVMIEVSVYQLMKCTVIVFVAILKRIFMNTRLCNYMWAGVVLNMVAVTLVASTSFIKTDDDVSSDMFNADNYSSLEAVSSSSTSNNNGLGILLVVLSCAVQAAQYVFEEKVMGAHGGNVSFPPLVVVGFEGLYGLMFSLVLVLPIAAALPGKDCTVDGHCAYEDTLDTLRMCGDSAVISWMLFAYVLIITGYNAAGIGITFLCDSVWHSILDNFRPVSVWGAQLVIYQITDGSGGEEWKSTSWIQLGGLVLLLFGTAVYNGNIRFPCFSYPGYSPGDMVDFNVESNTSTISPFTFDDVEEEALATSLITSPFVTARSPYVRSIIRRRASSQEE